MKYYVILIVATFIIFLTTSCKDNKKDNESNLLPCTLTVANGDVPDTYTFTYTITNITQNAISESDHGIGTWYNYTIVNSLGSTVWPHPGGALGPDTIFSLNANGGTLTVSVDWDGSTISVNALPPGTYTAVFSNIFSDKSSRINVSIPVIVLPAASG